ncbi:hypothetical protein F2981_33690 (plasmid) [Sinorhizobium meliloti]|nr:hypothetical protein [Sinorhizobium meliloti]
MLLKAYWLLPLSGLGVTALAVWWAWSLGSLEDQVPQNVGRGCLTARLEVDDPPAGGDRCSCSSPTGWFFRLASLRLCFLWTVAPNWPPPAYLEPGRLGPALALAARSLPWLASAWPSARSAACRALAWPFPVLRRPAALGAAAVTVLTGMRHNPTLTNATLWVVAGYVLFHAAVAGLMTAFLGLRAAAG